MLSLISEGLTLLGLDLFFPGVNLENKSRLIHGDTSQGLLMGILVYVVIKP